MNARLPLLCIATLSLFLSSCGAFRPANPGDRTTQRSTRTKAPREREDPTSFIRTDITQHAQELLGIPYKYGGNRPNEGFDCSGLTRYLYQNAGLDLARTSRDQAKMGTRVDPAKARPGDLVFYKRPGGNVFHVSVVVMATQTELWVIHATSSRGVMREDILASSYWRPKIYQVRNVF